MNMCIPTLTYKYTQWWSPTRAGMWQPTNPAAYRTPALLGIVLNASICSSIAGYSRARRYHRHWAGARGRPRIVGIVESERKRRDLQSTFRSVRLHTKRAELPTYFSLEVILAFQERAYEESSLEFADFLYGFASLLSFQSVLRRSVFRPPHNMSTNRWDPALSFYSRGSTG